MTKTYSVYEIGSDARRRGPPKIFRRATDEAAARKARMLLDGCDVEIWQGKRFVLRLQYRRGGKRITRPSGPLSYKIQRELRSVLEKVCEACAGKGSVVSEASTMRKVYAPRCTVCGGKGRVPSVAEGEKGFN
jgi:hypothetical protein